jgi:hypothetical protein
MLVISAISEEEKNNNKIPKSFKILEMHAVRLKK